MNDEIRNPLLDVAAYGPVYDEDERGEERIARVDSGVDVEAPARYYMDHDGDGVMCLWLDYGPGDEFPVSLLREGSVAPELWDAAVRMLVVDDVSIEMVARAIHAASTEIAREMNDESLVSLPWTLFRDVRIRQARAALEAFGAVVKGE